MVLITYLTTESAVAFSKLCSEPNIKLLWIRRNIKRPHVGSAPPPPRDVGSLPPQVAQQVLSLLCDVLGIFLRKDLCEVEDLAHQGGVDRVAKSCRLKQGGA